MAMKQEPLALLQPGTAARSVDEVKVRHLREKLSKQDKKGCSMRNMKWYQS
jgi:hypothetical protein